MMNAFSSRGRGGSAPRRGRGNGGRVPFNKPKEQVKPDIKKNPLGSLIKTISASDLVVEAMREAHNTEICGCQYVASYNWLNDEVPTVVVPGKPPQWTPLGVPQRLKEDSGEYFRDLNQAKYPSYPTAPIVHAIMKQEPEYPTTEMDLFACGSTLGNLLRFARGVEKAFRFNVEVIGSTVFFVRKENDPKELIKGVVGFGHTFPEAYTTWGDLKDSISHQRVVRYTFGGMQCLVRFESDGYLSDVSPRNDSALAKRAEDEEDDMLKVLQRISVTTSSAEPSNAPGTPAAATTHHLTVQKGGHPIPQAPLFDLKTRSHRSPRGIDMSDIYPQLWLKRIPNFIAAYHDGAGLFTDIRVQNVAADVQGWADANAEAIKRFAALLRNILQVALDRPHALLEVYCPGSPDQLEIRRQYADGVRTLPRDLHAFWAGNERVGGTQRPSSLFAGGAGQGRGNGGDGGSDSELRHGDGKDDDDDDVEPDYTACSAEDCGYCGRCSY